MINGQRVIVMEKLVDLVRLVLASCLLRMKEQLHVHPAAAAHSSRWLNFHLLSSGVSRQ